MTAPRVLALDSTSRSDRSARPGRPVGKAVSERNWSRTATGRVIVALRLPDRTFERVIENQQPPPRPYRSVGRRSRRPTCPPAQHVRRWLTTDYPGLDREFVTILRFLSISSAPHREDAMAR